MNRAPKTAIKCLLPRGLLNRTLLRFPQLYGLNLVMYETNLSDANTVEELLDQLRRAQGLKGDVIECGSSRCGASILMAKQLRSSGVEKVVLACDSYEGFDRNELAREREAGLTSVSGGAFTSTSFEYVQRKLNVLGMSDMVSPIKGFFRDTLPHLHGPFCFALIDCDLQESLVYAAETVWPGLSPGGRMVFDDYTDPDWGGAERGVDLFLSRHRDEIEEHGLLTRLYYVRKDSAACAPDCSTGPESPRR